METQFYIEYEIENLITNKSFITDSREEVISCYEEGNMVYEHHVTVCVPLPYSSTRQVVSLTWNNTPNFEV